MRKRTDRLNSLLREVISEVIKNEVNNPAISKLTSVTSVDISPDLHHAKIYISIIGSSAEKIKTIQALKSAAGFIAKQASKKVVMRYFPSLSFKLDKTVEEQAKIEEILKNLK